MTRQEMTDNGYKELKRGESYSIWIDDESGDLVARSESSGTVNELEVDLYSIFLAILGGGSILGAAKWEG